MPPLPLLDLYTIIPHASESRLLLLPRQDRWSLPHLVTTEAHLGIVGHINQALKARWGVDVTVLRCVYDAFDPTARSGQRVYALENHSPVWGPPRPGRWVAQDEISDLTLAVPAHRPVIEAWFDQVEQGNVPKQRVEWGRPGWFKSAEKWIYEQLDRLAIEASGPVEQLRAWVISCILRISTTAGALYFKAVSEPFSHAPRLIQELAGVYPQHLPTLLAVDQERRWFLMRDFGKETLDQARDFTRWIEAVRRFARIQARLAGSVDTWLEIGCPDLRLEWLASQIDSLLFDSGATLSAAENEQLRTLGPRLRAACEQLAACGVPATLVNNDFHAGNVVATATEPIFFDWADSAVSCPFFSLTSLLDAENFVPGAPDAWVRVRDAYLEAWTGYAPMSKLVAAFELALPVGALYHALNHQRVVERIETDSRWELEAAVPYWLKKLLHHRHRLPRGRERR